MSARQTVRLPGPFAMRHGGVLPEVDIVYETWGTPYARAATTRCCS